MVDFNKRILNTDKFRGPALMFQRTGMYCTAPKGTSDYTKYWDSEMEKCLHGYTADDGDYITGFHYFYLNYCPILRMVDYTTVDRRGNLINKRKKDLGFPSFYDYDYFFFGTVEEAMDAGKHMAVLKSRRQGYSYKGGSMLCRNYYMIPNSKGYVYASDSQYLDKDGIITKAWQFMDFIDEHTAWGKKRQVIDRNLHRRASISVTDALGNKIEQGYKSEIIGASLKSDPHKLRGKSAQLIFFEEGGSFPELAEAWTIARPSVEQDGETFGFMMVWGTGGEEGAGFRDLRDMFYNPSTYNIYGMKNIWDVNPGDGECGFFVPQYVNQAGYMDKDGNTMYAEAMEFIQKQRSEVIDNATNTQMVDRYIAERCITPAEACLELSGNIFPKKDLQAHLSNIRVNKKLQNHKQVGDLVWVDSRIQWIQKKTGDITNFPLKSGDDPTGSIVIWEHPATDAPHGLYIAGCDPYDHDISGTNSLGSVFIYKRMQGFEDYYDLPVAEYTGRPGSAEEFYENVRKLLVYYNARMLYENQNKGLFSYFANKHCDYLLADQPDIISDIINVSKVQRRKGIHMTQQIKDTMEGWIKDWLNEEYAPGKKNLTKILSEPLLEELIQYNHKGNFDRVISFGLVMVFLKQLHNLHVKTAEEVSRTSKFLDTPLFGKDWFNDSQSFNEVLGLNVNTGDWY